MLKLCVVSFPCLVFAGGDWSVCFPRGLPRVLDLRG